MSWDPKNATISLSFKRVNDSHWHPYEIRQEFVGKWYWIDYEGNPSIGFDTAAQAVSALVERHADYVDDITSDSPEDGNTSRQPCAESEAHDAAERMLASHPDLAYFTLARSDISKMLREHRAPRALVPREQIDVWFREMMDSTFGKGER